MENDKNVIRETLVRAAEACEAAFAPVIESVKNAERAVLERAVDGCGEVEIYVNSYAGFEIAIPDEKNPRWYRVELGYQKSDWREATPRRLEMNVAGYGHFGTGDTSKLRLMKLVGHLAERLPDIEKELAQVDWATFDALRLASRRAHDAIEEFDRETKDAAKEAEKVKAARALGAGVMIEKSPATHWNPRVVVCVEKVTEKFVFWHDVYERHGDAGPARLGRHRHQTKKEEVLAKLADGAWKIVETVKVVAPGR